MSLPAQDAVNTLFPRMEAKLRDVVERRFRVRLHSHSATELHQAAWDVYQNATVKVLEILHSGVEIGDPEGYAAKLARHRCSDYWRAHCPHWQDLKGRLYRFLGKQEKWTRWTSGQVRGWLCAPAGWESRALAPGSRVSALLDNPRMLPSRDLPKSEVFQKLDAMEWDRLLHGVFTYLDGPIRLDELVSIAGVLFGVKGSRELAFDDLVPDAEGDRTFDPPAPPVNPLDRMVIQQRLGRLWSEIKTMPRRWFLPFLLNPPSVKGTRQAERGEIDVFTANGFTTLAELAEMAAFDESQYRLLWKELNIETPFDSVSDGVERFSHIWSRMPLDDSLIARLMSLESPQKVINLRMVARNHLAKSLLEAEKTGGAN